MRKLDGFNLTKFKNCIRKHLGASWRYIAFGYNGKRYNIHVCYALTKFTQENAQNNNNEGIIDIFDKLYFEPMYIIKTFRNCTKIPKDDLSLVDKRYVNDFRNVYGAIRQIVQSKRYDSLGFLRLLCKIGIFNCLDKTFILILFSLTNKDILKDVSKTQEWTERIKKRRIKQYKFSYIEDFFMYNADSSLTLLESCHFSDHGNNIINTLFDSINMNMGLYRERCLYQQLLFYPKFKFFKDFKMKQYIYNLNNTGQFNNNEKRVQIARDLIFNKFYYESVVESKSRPFKPDENLWKFRKNLIEECKRYKNKIDIENEREALKKVVY
ncbi:hypothetical protein PAEPH01_0642 [Pancytospora epiphaga]|nr:hypothetical protein PAEPH01_0642 [Pancytospora epiphaga]